MTKSLVKGAGLGLALLLLHGATAAGQERRVQETDLPAAVADETVRFFNDSTTIRLERGGEVPSGRTLDGDVAVLTGTFVLGGEVTGDLAVINGDVRFRSGSRVGGDVTVVGGAVEGEGAAEIDGRLTIYSERLRYVREEGRIVRVQLGEPDREGISSNLGLGRSRITVRAGTNYNRVEGLPVMFGPIIETASSNPLRLEALAVWRTNNGFTLDTDELGYRVTLEQYLGGRGLFSVGASAHSLIEPVERWTVTDLEGSLSTFLFHRDYRDYYESTGWSGFARVHSAELPLSARLEYRDQEHELARVGSPWALKANAEPWRPQPLVAEGRLRTLEGTLTLDTRNDREEPTDGWWIEARATVGVGGSPEIRQHVLPFAGTGEAGEPATVPAAPVGTEFSAGFLDARSYNRIGPGSELVVRAVLGGSLTEDPLPPQLQHALGGEGSLPGFSLLAVDCGARASVAGVPTGPDGALERVFPAYGCDRMALFQAEVRGGMGWSVDLGGDDESTDVRRQEWGWDSDFEFRPRWAAFLDAGRGWAPDRPREGTPALFDEETRLDVGLGVLVGDLGAYVAIPLSGPDEGVNFFLRLGRRF